MITREEHFARARAAHEKTMAYARSQEARARGSIHVLKEVRLQCHRWIREYPHEPWTPELREQLATIREMLRTVTRILGEIKAQNRN